MPGNPPNNYAGITDESRVHKPPGGDTNDIFGLESRQKCQASQLYSNSQKIMTQEAYNKHDIPKANCMDYAGVTDKTRVRKPPGGDTNDIFDMESRQRSQAATNQMNLNKFMDAREHYQTSSGMQNLQGQKSMTCVVDTPVPTNQMNPDPSIDCALSQMDKENLHLLSNASEEVLKKKSLEDKVESKPAKMYLVRNPITGEVSEMKASACSKMSDRSNVVSNPDIVVKKSELNKPCVRVRQPPGGMSSNIF